MLTTKLLVIPPVRRGGGPGNAVSRIVTHLREQYAVEYTPNIFGPWEVALINVGTGVRLDVVRLLRLSRRLVYRVDGCFSRLTFERQGRSWQAEYNRTNRRIAKVLRIADFVVYQSAFSKDFLDELYRRKIGTYAIIPNGIDLKVFSPAEAVNKDVPVLGCIGTFRANRVRHLLDIARKIPFEHRFLLIGRMDDQCRQDLVDFQQGNPHHCHLDIRSPVIGNDALTACYQQIDCFLHPVIGDTCSNAVIEALACGVPVVVPAWSGSSELVGEGGVVIQQAPWENYEAFTQACADAVVEILAHQVDFRRAARVQAVSRFDIGQVAAAYYSALTG